MPDAVVGVASLPTQISARWAAMVAEGRPEQGALRRSAPFDEGSPAAYAALDHEGDLHLLIEAKALGPEDDSLIALTMRHRPLVIDRGETQLLDIAFHGTGLDDIAAQFAASVLEAVWAEPAEAPALSAAVVLERWRRFLESAPGWKVSAATLAPVVAELLVARDIVQSEPHAIRAWRGEGARHDFVGGLTALEVKSTLAHTAYSITVHGVDQLEPPDSGRLLLEFIRLEATPGSGVSAPVLVDEIEEAGVPRSEIRAVLKGPGLAMVTSEEARAITFSVRERRMIPVGSAFPRIVNGAFVEGAPPAGVEDVHYRVNITGVVDTALSAQGRLHVLGAIGQGALGAP